MVKNIELHKTCFGNVKTTNVMLAIDFQKTCKYILFNQLCKKIQKKIQFHSKQRSFFSIFLSRPKTTKNAKNRIHSMTHFSSAMKNMVTISYIDPRELVKGKVIEIYKAKKRKEEKTKKQS